jgi:hypothetical protein
MTDNATPETRKVSVTYERKQGTDDYGNITARVWIEDTIEADASPAVAAEKAQELFSAAKAAVYDELGIEVLMDENGVIREKYTPKVQSTQSAGEKAARRELGGYDTKGLEVAGDLKEDIPDYVAEICRNAGVTKVWANEGKYGPFYKEFVSAGATPKLGVDSQGRSVIISKPK